MNVYFACSITGGREFEPVYQAITAALAADGHEVPTSHLADAEVKALEARISPRDVYERDVAWIRACQALVAEVSTPSHGVGYEIATALGLGKPVLCLYREGRAVSKMLTGNSFPNIRVSVYRSTDEALSVLRSFLGQL
ncbi:MAG TPA: nucleoside 2-deoxyribosyltransferase [Anaerolineales bacterium]|nr:nucleoside 2-deoxyribosyltransferase [Anaerolineales bacterium]